MTANLLNATITLANAMTSMNGAMTADMETAAAAATGIAWTVILSVIGCCCCCAGAAVMCIMNQNQNKNRARPQVVELSKNRAQVVELSDGQTAKAGGNSLVGNTPGNDVHGV